MFSERGQTAWSEVRFAYHTAQLVRKLRKLSLSESDPRILTSSQVSTLGGFHFSVEFLVVRDRLFGQVIMPRRRNASFWYSTLLETLEGLC